MKTLVLRALSWNVGVKVSGQIFMWAITILVVRLLTPEDYGLLAMAMIFVSFVSIINEIGLSDVLIQTKELEDRLVRQIFGLVLILNFVCFAALFLSAPWIAHLYGEARVELLIRVLSFNFILMAFGTVQESLLIRRLDFKSRSLIDTGADVVGSLTTLGLAFSGMGVWSLVVGHLVISTIATVGYNVAVRMPLRPVFSLRGMRTAISFGGFVTADRVLAYLYSQADLFIIGKLLGKELLGFYSIAANFAHLPMTKLNTMLNVVGFSAFSRVQHATKEVGYYHLKTVRLLSLIAFPVFLGISSVSPEFVLVFLGEKWIPSSLPLQLICLVMPLQMISNILFPAVLGMGRADIGFRNSVIYAVVMPVSFAIGSNWGIVGVSLAWVIGFPLAWVVVVARTLPVMELSFRDYLTIMWRPFAAACIMFGSVHAVGLIDVSAGPLTLLIGKVAVGALVYSGLTLVLQREVVDEVWDLLRSFKGQDRRQESYT